MDDDSPGVQQLPPLLQPRHEVIVQAQPQPTYVSLAARQMDEETQAMLRREEVLARVYEASVARWRERLELWRGEIKLLKEEIQLRRENVQVRREEMEIAVEYERALTRMRSH